MLPLGMVPDRTADVSTAREGKSSSAEVRGAEEEQVGSVIHRKKIRQWQALCVLSRFVSEQQGPAAARQVCSFLQVGELASLSALTMVVKSLNVKTIDG